MSHKIVVDVIFTEILNRYQNFFIQQIRLKFEGDDVKDVFQDFCIHLYTLVQNKYSTDIDLFSSKAWLKTVVSNFAISVLRKKNKKRAIKFISEEKTEFIRSNYSLDSDGADFKQGEPDFNEAMNNALSHLNKREALILKMKYFYGKSSASISRLLNVAHVDVTIGRLKQRIVKKTGIADLDIWLGKFDWLT